MPPSDQSHTPALSFSQPWLSGGILRFGKRIENRTGWRSCKYRGPIWLHASQNASRAFDESAEGLREVLVLAQRRDDWQRYSLEHLAVRESRGEQRFAPKSTIPLGAICGHARIVDAIAAERDFDRWVDDGVLERDFDREAQRAWWFGGVALVLDEVVEIEPVKCKGALGLWRVPEKVETDARAALAKAQVRP